MLPVRCVTSRLNKRRKIHKLKEFEQLPQNMVKVKKSTLALSHRIFQYYQLIGKQRNVLLVQSLEGFLRKIQKTDGILYPLREINFYIMFFQISSVDRSVSEEGIMLHLSNLLSSHKQLHCCIAVALVIYDHAIQVY